jgi:hypothetical protein
VGEIADDVQTVGPAGVDPALLQMDQRIVAVQVIRADGSVVRRSVSAPDVPLIPATVNLSTNQCGRTPAR